MRPIRLLLWFWLGLCAGQVLAQAPVRSYDSIVESGVLKVALYQDFAPYSFQQDGKSRGVDYEVAEALAAGLGLRLEVIWAPPGEKLDDDLRDYIWRGHYLRPHELADVMMRVPYDREFSYKSNEFGELINEHVVMFGPYQRERWQVAYDQRRLDAVPSIAVFQRHPIGVEVDSVPSFVTVAPIKAILPPTFASVVGAESRAPASTVTAPYRPPGGGGGEPGCLRRPAIDPVRRR